MLHLRLKIEVKVRKDIYLGRIIFITAELMMNRSYAVACDVPKFAFLTVNFTEVDHTV